jgi:hypothetical protein
MLADLGEVPCCGPPGFSARIKDYPIILLTPVVSAWPDLALLWGSMFPISVALDSIFWFLRGLGGVAWAVGFQMGRDGCEQWHVLSVAEGITKYVAK